MTWIVEHQFSKRNLKKSERIILLSKVEEQIAKEAKERQLANIGGDRRSAEYKKTVESNLTQQKEEVETGRTAEIMAKKSATKPQPDKKTATH